MKDKRDEVNRPLGVLHARQQPSAAEGIFPPGEHPDPGLLAAHAERRLSGAEAALIDEHLATCSTCFEVFSETVRFVLDEAEVAPEEPVPSRVHRLVRAWPSQLAAVLLVAVGAWALLKLRHGPSGGPQLAIVGVPRSAVAELADAMGTRRFVEPRLTGGFQYGRFIRLRGDTREGLDAQPPAVLSAVARIRERAQADTSPETLGALGVTYLVSGDVGAAVKALESATAQAPENSRLQSDLSAAYLVRASRLDEPADIPKGLEAAEKAVALKDAPTEAWFNRALALESLHLTDAARKAWQDYLTHDMTSPWAEEARRHLADLPAAKQSTVEEDRARVHAALDEGPTAVNRLADESPAMLREYFDNELLSAWAEALLADRPEARALRERAQLVGKALLRTTGDALPRDAALAMAPSGPSRDPPRTQALGYRALRQALHLYEEQPSAACPVFRESRRLLLSGGSPYAEWTRERIVSSCLYPTQLKPALAELARIESVAGRRSYVQLLGRVRWMQGLMRGSQGDLTSSLERYLEAVDSLHAVQDAEGEAALRVLLAQNFQYLAERRRAWRERALALALLNRVGNPRRRHVILDQTALACLDARLLRSALEVQTTLLWEATRWANAIAISESLARRSLVEQALGSSGSAASDLAAARGWCDRIGDESLAERVRAEVDVVEGLNLASDRPERAVVALRGAMRYFERTSPVFVPGLRLALARALLARGLDGAAEAELRAGIQLVESQRASLKDVALQASFFEGAVPLFGDMVALQIDRRHDPDRALSFVERERAREIVDSLAPLTLQRSAEGQQSERRALATADPRELQRQLPAGLALVYYACLERRLLAWVLTRSGSSVVERPVSEAELEKLVSAQRSALEERAGLPAVREAGARLYDELVRPIVAVSASARALVIVPDAALHLVSFASLWNRDTGRYLVEDYVLGLAPSGTVFIHASSAVPRFPRTSNERALVVGNPRVDGRRWAGLASLPGAEVEATQIARLYNHAELLTGNAATKGAFLARLRGSTIVHFAGHAASSLDEPAASRLLLAPDWRVGDSGALYLRDLRRLDLPQTRVVVLAACRTASGAVSHVEGALSLSRPFLAAGVPNVVGSLWDVDDEPGRTFLVRFHEALLALGDPAQALRRTQLSLLRQSDPSLSHPASWAGFVSIGGLSLRNPTD